MHPGEIEVLLLRKKRGEYWGNRGHFCSVALFDRLTWVNGIAYRKFLTECLHCIQAQSNSLPFLCSIKLCYLLEGSVSYEAEVLPNPCVWLVWLMSDPETSQLRSRNCGIQEQCSFTTEVKSSKKEERTWAEITLIIPDLGFSPSFLKLLLVGWVSAFPPSSLASEWSQVPVLSGEILTTWSRVWLSYHYHPPLSLTTPPPLPITHLNLSGPELATHPPPPTLLNSCKSILPSSLNLGPSNS